MILDYVGGVKCRKSPGSLGDMGLNIGAMGMAKEIRLCLQKLHEFSETYETYWTTGDFLEALTPGKFETGISVVRNFI